MQPIEQALNEVRSLHERLNRTPAPELGPQSFVPFPAGQDPVAYAIDEVARLKQFLDQQVQDAQGTAGAAAPTPRTPSWVPRASVFASESGLTFELEIPGVAREDLEVTVAHGELIVTGQRAPVPPADGYRPVVVEQSFGAFERRFPLPGWATAEQISARYEHGVLEIALTRNEDESAGGYRVEIG